MSLVDLSDFITGAITHDPSTVLHRLFGAVTADPNPQPSTPGQQRNQPREKTAAQIRAELARATA